MKVSMLSKVNIIEGVGSLLDVINAHIALITAEESYIESLVDLQISWAKTGLTDSKEFEEIF
ncbi:hypothetical protein KAR48_02900 [bacterium]|nr:hypothetical protein [bacterium]